MTVPNPNTVVVSILDKDYQVTCPPEQEGELRSAAAHLDKQMREIRTSGKVVGLERIAVMVALNNTYELLSGSSLQRGAEQEIQRLHNKLDEALHRFRQLEID